MKVQRTNVPSANSPQLLTRLLEAVARGVRTTRGLQEALGVQTQTVRSYAHAAEWLGLLAEGALLVLSPLGLEFAYAGKRRPQVYAAAVWSVPFAAELFLAAGDGRLPDRAEVERALARLEPDLAAATLRRRATAVRSLIAPAVGRPRPRARRLEDHQLPLPLHPTAHARREPVLSGEAECDPDAYRFLWCALLDHGELSLGQVRAMFDRVGGSGLPIGGLAELATGRGDAVRLDERLVITMGGVARRDLADGTPSTMLSDPGYRAYLTDLRGATFETARRYRQWDLRLFGHAARTDSVRADLATVLMDRELAAYPAASGPQEAPPRHAAPFLDVWETPGLPCCVPPSLTGLQGGVAAVNRMLERARAGTHVHAPDLADRPAVFHGGLLSPGEPLPRAIPDLRTLQTRALSRAPAIAVVAAILLLHRLRPERLSLVRGAAGWGVPVGLQDPVPLAVFLERFASGRGWLWSTRLGSDGAAEGLACDALLTTVFAIGIATPIGRIAVLSEALFERLTREDLEPEVIHALRRLAEVLDDELDAA